MKTPILLTIISIGFTTALWSQVTLDADNIPNNTYQLINSVLAPGYDAVEVPDCSHLPDIVKHIDEVFDADLNINVFRFTMHVTPDNDRCNGSTDRQRNEIKTYDKSPANLKAVEGESVIYKWKFKLPLGFQPTTSFTHIHQIKSVGGPHESIPMFTFTLRKGNSPSLDKLELRYAPQSSQSTLKTANLDLFRGHWVAVTEAIHYNTSGGSYSLEIRKVSDNSLLFSHVVPSLVTWQAGASFARPKWGIYRSLNNISDLRDEEVLFANFSIEEVASLSVDDLKTYAKDIILTPNPSNNMVTFKNAKTIDYDDIVLYDSIGKQIPTEKRLENDNLDVSGLPSGLYYVVFKKGNQTKNVLKCMVK